jgi:hypothetical protein
MRRPSRGTKRPQQHMQQPSQWISQPQTLIADEGSEEPFDPAMFDQRESVEGPMEAGRTIPGLKTWQPDCPELHCPLSERA